MSNALSPKPVDVTYDSEAAAFYVRLATAPVARSAHENECVLIDLDAEDRAIGIEILRLDRFDVDACAAKYGFSDRAGAIGMALATATT